MKYWVEYVYPIGENLHYNNLNYAGDIEIVIDEFDAKLPDGAVAYEVTYGTDTIKYRGYCVYKGKVMSFLEAKERFARKDVYTEITEEMVRDCKTTKELQKQFSNEIDLQNKFEEFVKECEQMEGLKNFEECTEDTAFSEIQGIVIIDVVECPHYIYETDVVI